MLVALETSTRTPSVALEVDGVVSERVLSPSASHASDLLPALDELMRARGADPGAIEAVFLGLGPGSYTGLRVGIATGLGLARGARAKLLGVPSGEVLAFGALAEDEECVQLLDARHGELYFAHYARRAQEVAVLVAPCVLRPAELETKLPRGVRIYGDESVARAAALDAEQVTRLTIGVAPRARALLELARARLARDGPTDPDALEPLYLRPFDARIRKR